MAAAGALLGLVWLAAPPAAPPLYDGLGFPDEPYRFVDPPPGIHTAAPTSGLLATAVTGGKAGGGYANSAEQGPQVSVYLPPSELNPPPGARTVLFRADPKRPPPIAPADGHVEGNAYALSASVKEGDTGVVGQPVPASNNAAGQAVIYLRALSGAQPGPVVERLVDGRWQRLKTMQTGSDVFAALLPGLGTYALVRLDHPSANSTGAGGGVNGPLLGFGIALLALVLVVSAVRFARRTGVRQDTTQS